MSALLSIAQATQPTNDGFPWLELFAILISALAVFFTWRGLTWKKELRTRRRMQFLDEFNDSFVEFYDTIWSANDFDYDIEVNLRLLYKQHVEVTDNHPDRGNVDWAAEFLDGSAVGLADQAQERLKKIEPAKTKMKALASKGHVLHLNDYKSFESDSESLIAYWEDSQSFTSLIIRRKKGTFQDIDQFTLNALIYKIVDMADKDFNDLGPTRNETVKRIKEYLAEQCRL